MSASLDQCGPEPATLERAAIERMAGEARAKLASTHHGSLESLLRSMGIAVRQQPLHAERREGRGDIRLVVLPDGTGEHRQGPLASLEGRTEMLAEAVAHATLHARPGRCTIVEAYPQERDGDGRAAFHQPSWFRDALLMPEDEFGLAGADPVALARRHGVGERAARRRVARLRQLAGADAPTA